MANRQSPESGTPLFPMREVVLGTYVPSLLFGMAVGITLPLIPTSARLLGADLATAGFVAALLPLGKMLADVPAGVLATRIGDRRAMLVAAVLGLIGLGGASLAQSLWILGVGMVTLGAATAVFHLARHAYLTDITPDDRRARVLSTLGGMHRLGYFIGPFLGALVVFGSSVRPAFVLAATALVATLVVLVTVRGEPRAATTAMAAPPGLWAQLRRHRTLFATLGAATLLVGAVRGTRQTILPLWGEHVGFEPAVISAIFGISGAVDMLLFYPAGKAMDRYGRLWVAVPSMLGMAAAMALLPLAHSVAGVSAVAVLLGVGNGLGSGIMMTLGADVAPAEGRSSFLGVWRLLQDVGDAAGPLVLTAGAAVGSLAAGVWCTAVLGASAAGALGRWVPRFSVHANAQTRRKAGIAL